MKKTATRTVTLFLIVRNEREASEVIFPQIPKKSVDEIIVIDGHSTDGTQAYFKKQKVKVYEQTIRGLGGATFEARKRCKTDAMIFFHPDGNEDPRDIAIVSDYLKRGKQFVIPSRMIKGARNEEDDSLFRPRKWFNKSLALFMNILWNENQPFVSEIVQGFRGISVTAYDKMNLDRTDLTIDFHMVIRAVKLGIPIFEFPTIEGDRLFGETQFKSIDTGVKELKMLFREIFDPTTYPHLNQDNSVAAKAV